MHPISDGFMYIYMYGPVVCWNFSAGLPDFQEDTLVCRCYDFLRLIFIKRSTGCQMVSHSSIEDRTRN